jgi:predicted TIM-barrel fold metal-dependent hydrolase
MWGTDYPLIMHAEGLSQIDEMDLKPEARVALLHDTAVKVFKFDEPLLNDETLIAGTEPLVD